MLRAIGSFILGAIILAALLIGVNAVMANPTAYAIFMGAMLLFCWLFMAYLIGELVLSCIN